MTKAGMGVFIAGVAAGVAVWLMRPSYYTPPEFSEARIRGATLAQKIAEAAQQSLDALAAIRVYDEKKVPEQALILISQEVIRNKGTQQEAIQLSSELEKMARLVSDIKPARARLMATEAVSSEVALVSRLLSYTNNLIELFGVLRLKFEKPNAFVDGAVAGLIDKINEEARAINSFNQRFNSSLAEFDKIFLN